jgi:hypothetical protein
MLKMDFQLNFTERELQNESTEYANVKFYSTRLSGAHCENGDFSSFLLFGRGGEPRKYT